MNVGIDIHGVIDHYDIFAELSLEWAEDGHTIHIITGQEWSKVQHKVDNAGITYQEHFSIVDYHLAHGTKMWKRNNTWWMNEKI